jgi:hypothetical protein
VRGTGGQSWRDELSASRKLYGGRIYNQIERDLTKLACRVKRKHVHMKAKTSN